MTAIEKVMKLYADAGQDFGRDVGEHMATGYVFSTPDAFLMGWPDLENDTWYVQAAAVSDGFQSNLFFTMIPFPLKWVTFHRRGKSKTYELERIKLCCCSRF